jgi:hypothetical protein
MTALIHGPTRSSGRQLQRHFPFSDVTPAPARASALWAVPRATTLEPDGMWLRSTAVLAVAALFTGVVLAMVRSQSSPADDPWSHVAKAAPHVDHSHLITGPLADGPSVTRACLACHPQASRQVMLTGHWTWAGQKVTLPGTHQVLQIGKVNLLNNFCIHAGPNIEKCSSCHAAMAGTTTRSISPVT